MRADNERSTIALIPPTSPQTDDDLWRVVGPIDHARFLHNHARKGNVMLASRGRRKDGWYQTALALGDEAPIGGCVGYADTYITYNTFHSRRRTERSVVAICALYADIDHYKLTGNPIATLSPEAVAALILDHLTARGIPLPSIVLATGQGVGLTWVIDPIPARAHGRWKACQKVLRTELATFGHDHGAIDATRLTRLAGTINSKNGRTVRVLPSSTFERHDFEALAERLLPYSRAEVHEFKAARRIRKAKQSEPAPGHQRRTVRTLHETRLADLRKLVAGRYGGTAPSGRRDEVVFIAAASLAFLVPPRQLRAAVVSIGSELAGWSASASLACASSVIARAEQRVRKPGTPDPRYRLSAEHIITNLAITDDEARHLDLRELRTTTVARERDRLRKAADRRAAGHPTKTARYDEHRRVRQRALDLSAQGLTAREVSEAMGLSRDNAKKLIQLAKKEGLKPMIRSQEQPPNIVVPGGESRVRVYDGKPQHLNVDLQSSPSARTWSEPIQLDLFGRLPPPMPWTHGGIIPDETRIALRAAIRATGSRHDKLAIMVGLSRPQLTNIIAGRFGTCPDVAQHLSTWASRVASAAA